MTKKNNFNSGDINSQNIDRTKELTLSNQEEMDTDNDFVKFFAVLKRRWLIFLVMTLGVTSGVGYWTYQLSPIYQGKFLLLIEKPQDQNNTNTNNNINIDGTLSPTSPGTVDYNTEVEILGSPSVLVPILEEVAIEYPDIFDDINLPNNENLSIKQLENTKIIEVAFKNQNPEKIKFVLDKIADSYLTKNLGDNENNVNEGLKFVRNQVPQLEKKVVSLETQLQNLRQEHKFIDPQAKSTELTQQLIAIEQEYLSAQINLKQANASYENLEKQLNLTLEQAIAVNDLNQSKQYQSLSKELQDLEIEIATKSAVFTDISPQMITLNEKKANLVKLLEEERKKVLSQHSGKINNQQSINLSSPNEIRTKLTEQMLLKGNEIKMLETKIENLKIALDDVNDRISKMPTITRKYTDLQRELQANADSLKRFLETREKLELENAQNIVNWRVISPPSVKEEPVYPVPLNNLMMGLLGGLIAGTITASIIDLLDGKIYSLSQLKEVTIYPVLGQIPWHKNSVKDVMGKVLPSFNTESSVGWMSKTSQPQEYTSSDWIESFRNFLTNIDSLNSNSVVNSLVISSPNSMEGKSTISLNLAQTAVAMGRKVLLIDADLRLPQLHRLLGIENNQGLSEVLSSELKLESVMQQVPSWDNLSVITAGNVSDDPTKLLYSQKMQEIVKLLNNCQTFDLIIYDSPSLLGFIDAKIIAPNTNGLILVMRLGRSDRNKLRIVTDQLKISRVPLLGIVANGIKN
ncbi:GumC family protein [Geminocystis herdmanii]|uniref:GumC family protein n=1 Tax=Geminocystis herdmanii TaxID=669359 RepID=UPI00034972CF|nr:polysaccharide biosynthesis tyrosine autokinase [Geminocystis herdmanii]